jgi:outer membrane protein
MRRCFGVISMIAVFTLLAGSAFAESIAGKIGVTGRLGFLVPADSELTNQPGAFNVSTDVGFVGGGGIIYGINKNIAAELDITHTGFDGDVKGADAGEFSTDNISLGVQYRFNEPIAHLTPYVGGGLDILINDFTANNGQKGSVDTVVGVHLTGGLDYFVMKQLAFTSEMKFVLAPDADISLSPFGKIGNFDPSSFSTTFGIRYFFN